MDNIDTEISNWKIEKTELIQKEKQIFLSNR